MENGSPWTVSETDDGWQVYYAGKPWIGAPRPTREEAEAYRDRLEQRYPEAEVERLLYTDDEDEEQNGRQRGGPWRWTIPEDSPAAPEHGTTGVIHTRQKQDAKAVLRRKMDRKRLPNGIEWEIA